MVDGGSKTDPDSQKWNNNEAGEKCKEWNKNCTYHWYEKKLMYTITWCLFMFISHVHIHMIWFHIKACTHGEINLMRSVACNKSHHVNCQTFCSMQQFASLMRFFLNRTFLYCKMCLIRFTINGQLKDVSRTHM